MTRRDDDKGSILVELWNKVVSELREEIPESSFNTWIDPVKVIISSAGALTLQVPNKFYQGWISENYEAFIKKKLRELCDREVSIAYTILDEEPAQERRREPFLSPFLNLKYTFDSFVVGTGNQFAHAASWAVAEDPGRIYNPLFIYGGVGLGKTHLLHAIGHKILETQNHPAVLYISAERFMNELIDGIRFDKMLEFRRKYRGAGVLLVDDVQFIAGKDRTQEEFFHTFNELYNNGRQIVISSDRFPSEMEKLEERLRSRFQWGLIADIQPPDLETRAAILKKKAAREKICLPNEVIFYIAKRVRSNVRELEGCLIRLGAMASLTGKTITLEMARRVLEDLFPQSCEGVTVEKVQQAVCELYKVKLSDMKSRKRNKNIVIPRQVAMYLARKLTPSSLPDLGEAFGGKDHTSVLHSIRKVEKLLTEDENLKRAVKKLQEMLEN